MKKKELNNSLEKGILYLCATPIGNLQDITLRALECLKEADLIAVESLERSRKLLNYYGISTPLISYRESNREKKGRVILERLKQGAKVVLITDAGMPSISDPGHYLIQLLLEEKISFTVLPGPSAALTALVMSGYSAKRFVFWGFLSRKKGELRKELEALAVEERTVIIYESPHRLPVTLTEMAKILKDRQLAVCRELTKKFEEVRRGSAGQLVSSFLQQPPRGEITLVISPLSQHKDNILHLNEECENKLLEAIKKGNTPTEAVKKVAKSLSLKRNEVYVVLMNLKKRIYDERN
ncbi:MAG: 16S rRNA (cytidine(1402)-2'-O)-methyltransferase [Dethiobacter sp.]|jgi:16S rRNA (cytidine1402-2'-O)-methyltransferase|nr:MAG: 16S rRNA (cytidine(1402)-2'-O)-methyltransferase [Dethiobacter sp.]